MTFLRLLSSPLRAFVLSGLVFVAPAMAQEPDTAEAEAAPDCTVEWRVTHEMMELWYRAIVARNCELAGQRGPICNGPLNMQVMEISAYLETLNHTVPEAAQRRDFDTYVREADLFGELQADTLVHEKLDAEMQAQTPPPLLMQHYEEACPPEETPEE